jgi:hypothetical protein
LAEGQAELTWREVELTARGQVDKAPRSLRVGACLRFEMHNAAVQSKLLKGSNNSPLCPTLTKAHYPGSRPLFPQFSVRHL